MSEYETSRGEIRARRMYDTASRLLESYARERESRMFQAELVRMQNENDRIRLARELDLSESDNG